MTFKQCDVKRNRICGSQPKENRLAGIEKKFNRTSNIFKLIPDQCQKESPPMINTTIESNPVKYSHAATTTSQLPLTEKTFYDEPAFDIRLEVIKKSLRQDDYASSPQMNFNYLFYYILWSISYGI